MTLKIIFLWAVTVGIYLVLPVHYDKLYACPATPGILCAAVSSSEEFQPLGKYLLERSKENARAGANTEAEAYRNLLIFIIPIVGSGLIVKRHQKVR